MQPNEHVLREGRTLKAKNVYCLHKTLRLCVEVTVPVHLNKRQTTYIPDKELSALPPTPHPSNKCPPFDLDN